MTIKTNSKTAKMTDFLQSVMEGAASEATFEVIARRRGNKVKEADKRTNIEDHIDYFVENKNGTISSIDVKAMKRTERNAERTDKRQWCEFMNVKGKDGWIYGKADYIAFETNEHFILFKRLDLLDFFTEKCPRELQNNPQEMPAGRFRKDYTPYRRGKYGREDSVILFPMSDILENLRCMKWEK